MGVIESKESLKNLLPLLILGTLLGAYRNQTLIPWTHDVDIAYMGSKWTDKVQKELRSALAAKGYLLFKQGIWRVCLHSQHPLAPVIYDPEVSANASPNMKGDVPYLDLYKLEIDGQIIRHETQNQSLVTSDIFPTKKIVLLGKEYDTFQQPEVFFVGAGYGNYMHERVEPHK